MRWYVPILKIDSNHNKKQSSGSINQFLTLAIHFNIVMDQSEINSNGCHHKLNGNEREGNEDIPISTN